MSAASPVSVHEYTMLDRAFMQLVLVPVAVILLVACTFAGDYMLRGFPAFYLCWFGLVLFRILCKIHYSATEALTQAVLLALSLPILIAHIWDISEYYHAFLFAVLYINVLPLLPWLEHRPRSAARFALVLLLVFFVFSVWSLMQGAVRANIVFGPNILYRIYAFLFGLIAIMWFSTTGSLGFMRGLSASRVIVSLFLLTGLVSVAMIATGSRGAVLTMLSLMLAFAWLAGTFSDRAQTLRLGIFVLILGAVTLVLVSLGPALGRLLMFDLGNASESVRLSYIYKALDFLLAEGFLGLIFGVGERNSYFDFYPHNIFLEALVYGGFYMLLVAAFGYLSIFVSALSRSRRSRDIIPYVGVMVGALLSGSMLDNYSILSLGYFVLVRELLWRNTTTEGPPGSFGGWPLDTSARIA